MKRTREHTNGGNSNCSDSTTSFCRKIAGDRIGIFKVPFVSPSDILKFEWVTETDCTNEGGLQDVGTVVFKGKIIVVRFNHLIRVIAPINLYRIGI